MKILITSDVHGKKSLLEEVIKKHPNMYHLNAGDIGLSESYLDEQNILSVKGNTDFFSKLPEMRLLEHEGLKILLTHGHLYYVKRNLDLLVDKAKSLDVNICIFGHTHMRYSKVIKGVLFLNPGALSDYERSYAIFDNGKVEFYKL
ncbi:MAG TPA: metallophosphoesterase [Acholeplasma sp.]|jgi:putative phosphoesterase|nr:metallophosphoesterase [Acholeplasma sp.]